VTDATLPSYALVTPARNEATNLRRLATSVERQTHPTTAWVIVDNGSTDETIAVAEELAVEHQRVWIVSDPGERDATRGGPVARAFAAGLRHAPPVDVIVKLDADISLEPDHFERLMQKFHGDPSLGLASGTCYELDGDAWRPVHNSRGHARGAVRAYRTECLADITPLEDRMGWDTVDELKAQIRGWTTTSFGDIVFYHHRAVGQRDGARKAWRAQGDLAHYLGYRPSYFLLKALFRSLREPAAVAMFWGYGAAMLRRHPRHADEAVRAWLRREQRLREVPLRVREVRGKPSDASERDSGDLKGRGAHSGS
jgi:glycosyltransferase involved in cell wall biosynthesis